MSEEPKKDSGDKVEISENQIQRVENAGEEAATEGKKGFKGLLSKLKPGAKREQQKAQMQNIQSGYSEVMGLVRSVREHLDRQEATQHRLIDSMESLPEALKGLKHISEATDAQRKLIEQHGKATEQQREMLGVIRNQLEGASEHNEKIAGSMDRFNDTLFSMDNTTRRIAEGARASEDTLRELVERSEKRFFAVSAFMGLLILLLAGLLVYLGMNGGLGGGPEVAGTPAPAPAVIDDPVQPEVAQDLDVDVHVPQADPAEIVTAAALATNDQDAVTTELDDHDSDDPDQVATDEPKQPVADPEGKAVPGDQGSRHDDTVPVEAKTGPDVEALGEALEKALLREPGDDQFKPLPPEGITQPDTSAKEPIKVPEPPQIRRPQVPLRGLPSIFPPNEDLPVIPSPEDKSGEAGAGQID